MITGSPGIFTSVWKKAAMSMGIRTQPCETGASGTSVSPWIANAVPMKNTELYMKPSGTAFAIHGDTDVPLAPVSHGCIRIPMDIAAFFHKLVRTPGTQVHVYGTPQWES